MLISISRTHQHVLPVDFPTKSPCNCLRRFSLKFHRFHCHVFEEIVPGRNVALFAGRNVAFSCEKDFKCWDPTTRTGGVAMLLAG